MKARVTFTGALSGGAKTFRAGDPITNAEWDALGLDHKPHLAEKGSKREAKKAKPADS